ncbi:iron-containing alcohol dehydrogenase [Candidatus Riflebacteria bacterium]
MQFQFATATRIIFKTGAIKDIGSMVSEFGRRVFVITGRNPARIKSILTRLEKADMKISCFNVKAEPTTGMVIEATRMAREKKCDFVIGIGGGSVLDTGKVVSALLTNKGALHDYLEVIGKGKSLEQRPAPYIAVPTTAGTGAEVTRNAVLSAPEHNVKVSMRSYMMLPELAIVDPQLTYSMSPEVTASTGLDALTQLMEVYVSKKSYPLTDLICREGMQLAANSLALAFKDGKNKSAREKMSLASLYGGMGLANAGLGAAHGFAGPLGGIYQAPHGMICASLLPFVMQANVDAISNRLPGSPVLKRYNEIARILTGERTAIIQDGIEWVKSLCVKLNIPPLSRFGLRKQEIPAVVEQARKSSSMQGNPIPLKESELCDILNKAILE